MMRSLCRAIRFATLVTLLVGAPAAWGQTDDDPPPQQTGSAEVNAGVQFNFSTPGARSLALGGAFIGLADDATAAFTNPAGLTILSKPEISIEGRSWRYTTRYTDRGHAFGDPLGLGTDTEAGIIEEESSTDVEGLSFSSFVYPRKRWAIAFYRHELANFEAGFRTQGVYSNIFLASGQEALFRIFPTAREVDLDIINLGVSFAIKLSERFSIGIGGSYYDFQLDARTRRYDFINPDPFAQGGFVGPPDYSAGNIVSIQTERGDDNDQTLTVGFLWNLGEKWSLGGVYRQGPSFAYTVRSQAGPSRGAPPGTIFFERSDVELNVPDVYGLGLVFRPTDALTLAFDWSHVEYSVLSENTAVNFFQDPDPILNSDLNEAARRLEVDDADELHLGLEYVFINLPVPLAIRLGAWYDPDHEIAFQGEPGMFFGQRSAAALFRPGDDEIHYAAGLGLVLGEHVQIDIGADFSDIVDTVSLSGVFRF